VPSWQKPKPSLQTPAMAGGPSGVCVLLGHEQAKYIDDLVRRHIPTHEIVARRIRVGEPPNFEGRESDIMFLSMVLEKGDRGLPNPLAYQQRMNVAASRVLKSNGGVIGHQEHFDHLQLLSQLHLEIAVTNSPRLLESGCRTVMCRLNENLLKRSAMLF
jgi:hypothetical protein